MEKKEHGNGSSPPYTDGTLRFCAHWDFGKRNPMRTGIPIPRRILPVYLRFRCRTFHPFLLKDSPKTAFLLTSSANGWNI